MDCRSRHFFAVVVALWESLRARKSVERELEFAREENRYLQAESRKHRERQEIRPVFVELGALERRLLQLEADVNADLCDSGVPLFQTFGYQLNEFRDPVELLIEVEIPSALTTVQIARSMITETMVIKELHTLDSRLKEVQVVLENFRRHIEKSEVGPNLLLVQSGKEPSGLVRNAFRGLAESTRANLGADL